MAPRYRPVPCMCYHVQKCSSGLNGIRGNNKKSPKLGSARTRPLAVKTCVTPKNKALGRFMVHTQEGSVLHVCTKFEADSSITSKVIRWSQNSEIRSHDPVHAHLGVDLYSVRRS